MLHSIFLYQTNSGLLMFDMNFQEIGEGKLELFSAFFSAIKNFIHEMVFDGSKDLKNIEMGNYQVKITHIPQIIADLVLIIDKRNEKRANKLVPKIIEILLKHQEIFLDWDGNRRVFKILYYPITELIKSEKTLLDEKSLTDNQMDILKSIWAKKSELLPQEKENLLSEKQYLANRLRKVENLIKKEKIIKKIVELTHQLKDDKGYLEYQKQFQHVKNEIKDAELKIKYYLTQIKNSLNDSLKKLGSKSILMGNYRDTYVNLYSLSSKVRKLLSTNDYQKFKKMAKILIEKDESRESELYQVIKDILNLKEENLLNY